MRRLLLWCAIACLLPGPGHAEGDAVPARESCAQRLAALVQSKYEAVRDLSARFDQTTHSVMGGPASQTESSGRVFFAKPGKMRWSYETPQPSEVISDGETLWLYDPGANEVQRLPVDQGYLAGAGLQFLLGVGKLADDFEIRAIECDERGREGALLELLPRQPASYERLLLRVRFDSGEVEETTVVDLFGNRTRIAFRELKLNQDPAPETFRFDVPPGVEVIDLVLSH